MGALPKNMRHFPEPGFKEIPCSRCGSSMPKEELVKRGRKLLCSSCLRNKE